MYWIPPSGVIDSMEKRVRFTTNADGSQKPSTADKNNHSKRQANAITKVSKALQEVARNYRGVNMAVVIGSEMSDNFPLLAVRHEVNDETWNVKFCVAIQQAILTKKLYPKDSFAGLIAPPTFDQAGLEATISEAQRQGILAEKQVKDIMRIAEQLQKNIGELCVVPPCWITFESTLFFFFAAKEEKKKNRDKASDTAKFAALKAGATSTAAGSSAAADGDGAATADDDDAAFFSDSDSGKITLMLKMFSLFLSSN